MSNPNESRGTRPSVERDYAANEALSKVFAAHEIASLAWSSTHEDFVRYTAKVLHEGTTAAVTIDLLDDDGAVVAIEAPARQTYFVCACGALLWSMILGGLDAREQNAHEIAATAEDIDGPAVACSACAFGRPTDEGFRDTVLCAPPKFQSERAVSA